jgi:hypothetical protein
MFTSCFSTVKNLPTDLIPVSIARGAPRGFAGRKELRLAPTWAMLKMSRPDFDQQFARMLARLDPAKLYAELGENAVLLCWEKPGEGCHRRMVAEWFEEALGVVVPEFGIDRAETPAYELTPWKQTAPKKQSKRVQLLLF